MIDIHAAKYRVQDWSIERWFNIVLMLAKRR